MPRIGKVSLALLVAALGLGAFPPARESVDFRQPPPQGLKFKGTETSSITLEGAVKTEANEANVKQTATNKRIFVQTYLQVEGGRVRKVERAYEDASGTRTQENEMLPEPQEMELTEPLAWKTLRCEWEGDRATLRVKEGDTWKEPSEEVRRYISAGMLRHPGLLLPREEKAVGDKWEFDSKALGSYYPEGFLGGAEVEGSLRCELTGVEDRDGVRCAVIACELELRAEKEVSLEIRAQGKAYYSLEHRIVVEMAMKGTMKLEGEIDQGGTTVTLSMAGPLKDSYKAEVLAPKTP